MKVAAWNLGHQTRMKPLPERFDEAVRSLGVDILFLNEYVDGEARRPIYERLSGMGLAHQAASVRQGKGNQVFAASSFPIERGDLASSLLARGADSNFLHVKSSEEGIELVGIRVPAYETKEELDPYWIELEALFARTADRPILFIGDFNTAPTRRTPAAAVLRRLKDRGWTIPDAEPWSYKTGTKIDHAVASPLLQLSSARYVTETDGLIFCSNKGPCMSDHAPIVVEVTRRD